MRATTAMLIATIGLMVGWLSGTAQAQETQDRECFDIQTISSWNALSDEHLYVKSIGSTEHFLLTMFTRCPGIRSTETIAFSDHMSRLCSNDFGNVTYYDGGVPRRCRIDDIERVNSRGEAKELVEAMKNAKDDDSNAG